MKLSNLIFVKVFLTSMQKLINTFRYYNHMMKRILISIFIILAATQSFNFGGYKFFNDLSNPQFQAVLSFIFQNHPEISEYDVTSVQRQLVNGFNYHIILSDNETNCRAETIIYTPFQGQPSENSYSNTCQPTNIISNDSTNQLYYYQIQPVQLSQQIAGGYSIQNNPSGSEFQSALASALAQNPQFSRSNLVLTQTQVVAGTNWRFTFADGNGNKTQIVVFVPLNSEAASQNPTITTDISTVNITNSLSQIAANNPQINTNAPISGGYSVVTNQSEYQQALSAIYAKYPQYKSYNVDQVKRQIVAGINYIIKLSQNSLNTVSETTFNVYIDLSGAATATQISWINVKNYTPEDVTKTITKSVEEHPQLQGYGFTSAENIWPDGSGLKLNFANGGAVQSVYVYTLNGREVSIMV